MAHSALSVIDVYEQLLSAPDDKTRARIIATAFERLEDRYPELKDLATATGVRETELRLLKEIEQIRQETQQIRADMHKFEQQVQANMHAMEQQIRKEIEQIRADMHQSEQQIRADMHQTELRLQKEIAEVHLKIEMTSKKQVQWMVGSFFTFAFTLIAAMFGVSML
jgi:seryl-tRNA synthetase